MIFPKKEILINNFKNVEAYLYLDVYDDFKLESLDLRDNVYLREVKELLSLIPDGYSPNAIKEFYEKTGLKIQVEVYEANYDLVVFDKDGRYPREDAGIWNLDFIEHLNEHPEWLKPQDEADILIRYVFQM